MWLVRWFAGFADRHLLRPMGSMAGVEMPKTITLSVFLVRRGEDNILDCRNEHYRTLTINGMTQAKQAGKAISRRIGRRPVIVFTCEHSPMSHQETAAIIAGELKVKGLPSSMDGQPDENDLRALYAFSPACNFVIVCDGRDLLQSLARISGPTIAMTVLGPLWGSVHQLVIEYEPNPETGEPVGEVSHRFV